MLARLLLDHGANPNVQDPQVKYSPLHCAILGYHMNRSDETCDFIESLLEHGANPRIMDRSGETAPHLSIGTLDFRIMSKFIEHLGPEVQVEYLGIFKHEFYSVLLEVTFLFLLFFFLTLHEISLYFTLITQNFSLSLSLSLYSFHE